MKIRERGEKRELKNSSKCFEPGQLGKWRDHWFKMVLPWRRVSDVHVFISI